MHKYLTLLICLISFMILTGCSSENNEYDGIDYSDQYDSVSEECIEPENPYGDGGGHDAGWQRGEEGKDCGGDSSSFIDGCEEYYEAYDQYETCLSANG